MGTFRVDDGVQPPAKGFPDSVLGRHDAGRTFPGEKDVARAAGRFDDKVGGCGIELPDGPDRVHHFTHEIELGVLVVRKIHIVSMVLYMFVI